MWFLPVCVCVFFARSFFSTFIGLLTVNLSVDIRHENKKKLYLGVYESELEAAKAHDRAARFHFPDKSMTNFATEAEADRLIAEQEVRIRFTGVGVDRLIWEWGAKYSASQGLG